MYALFTTATFGLVAFRGQPAACGRHGGGDEEEGRQPLAEQQERQGGADEGGKGVVGAGAGSADGALGVGIAVDAQTVGHKAEQQKDGDMFRHRKALADGQRNAEATGSVEARMVGLGVVILSEIFRNFAADLQKHRTL